MFFDCMKYNIFPVQDMFGVSEKSMNKGHNMSSCDEYNVKVFIMSICKGEE